MAGASCSSRIVVNKVRNGIRYAGFAPNLLLTCYVSFAAEPTPPPGPVYVYPVVRPSYYLYGQGPVEGALVSEIPAPKPFDGLGFGAGVAMTFGQPRVNKVVATGPNNIVRVTDSSSVSAGIVFESHYFFVPTTPFLGVSGGSWGHGPFVAVDASTSDGSSAVAGVSMGWMIGFRKTRPATVAIAGRPMAAQVADNTSWNFGVGFHVEPKATVLGDGIVANMPLPAGETNPVRTNTVPRYGVMLLTSFGF